MFHKFSINCKENKETISQQREDGVNQIEQSSKIMTLYDNGKRNRVYFQLKTRYRNSSMFVSPEL